MVFDLFGRKPGVNDDEMETGPFFSLHSQNNLGKLIPKDCFAGFR